MFVRPGIPEFMREVAVPAADIVTPNHFELDLLARTTTRTLEAVASSMMRTPAKNKLAYAPPLLSAIDR